MFKHILIATDGSEASDHAAALAVSMARIHGSRITAIFVVDPYPFLGIGETNPMGFQAYMSAALDHAADAHSKVEALCVSGNEKINLQVRVVEGVTAAHGIVQTAKDELADLIVLGSHGRSGIRRLMLGSVANKVVAESTIPVLVTR